MGVQKLPVLAEQCIGLGDDVPGFGRGFHQRNFIGDVSIPDHAVRRLDETVVIDQTVSGQRNDKTDVRAFRRFDGADAAVMAQVHVTHLETGPFTGQTARPQRGQTAFVRHFRQGVGLVHELGELRRAEKFLQYRRDRFRVDQIMGHERGHFLQAHALLDGPLHAHQTDAVLVFHQFAHRAHPPVAQMIDIIDFS